MPRRKLENAHKGKKILKDEVHVSVQSRLIERGMSLFKSHLTAEEEEAYLAEREVIQKQQGYQLPHYLKERYEIEKTNYQDMPVYILQSVGDTPQKHILYLHGGAYVKDPNPFHWRFLHQLTEAMPVTITVPIYPKAPTYTYVSTYSKILLLYRQLSHKIGAENIILMGDSAGGGLALGFAQYLKEKGLANPQHIILISPWLDLSLSNPEIEEYEALDPMLSVAALKTDAAYYAGDADLKHYMVSPIYGDFEGLAPLTLFVGTHEIFLPDVRKLKEKLEDLGRPFNYFEYPKMNHIFTTYPIPEAKKAILQIIDIISHSH